MPSSENTPILPLKGAENLALFTEFVEQIPEGYSDTSELFDAVLSYSSRRVRSTPEPDARTVTFRGREVRVSVSPAVIKHEGKPALIVMPGEREELVEKALRKIAADCEDVWGVEKDRDGRPSFSLRFTIYQIRAILKATGHDFKSKEIDEALRVLQGSVVQFDGNVDQYIAGQRSGILQSYTYVRGKGRTGWKNFGEVKFHPLVTAAIVEHTFRRIDFTQLMRLKVNLARWLYQRISHSYTPASSQDHGNKTAGYYLSLSTILKESGMERHQRMRDYLRIVRRAIAELTEKDLLRSFTETLRYAKASKVGRKSIVDALWIMKPSAKFVDDMTEANRAAIASGKLRGCPPVGW